VQHPHNDHRSASVDLDNAAAEQKQGTYQLLAVVVCYRQREYNDFFLNAKDVKWTAEAPKS
jgi:hypothetical protein